MACHTMAMMMEGMTSFSPFHRMGSLMLRNRPMMLFSMPFSGL